MARCAELSGVSLRAEDGKQILEGVTQALGVIVGELVDDLEKGAQGLRVAIRQVGIVEDVAKQGGNAGVLRHLGDGLGVEIQGLMAAKAGAHQLGPSVAGELAGEEAALSAKLLALGIHIVHELVDQRDGDLLDLALGVRNLAHQDVAGGVDAALGVGIQHESTGRTGSRERSP